MDGNIFVKTLLFYLVGKVPKLRTFSYQIGGGECNYITVNLQHII